MTAYDAYPSDPDNDIDGDAISGDIDNCPDVYNPDQDDVDSNGTGDVCEGQYQPVQGRPVPDTGQTTCYDAGGNVITCPAPGDDFYGQDGSYAINPPSYTKLDAEGKNLPDDATSWVMVRDNVTGLIWERKTDDGSIHDKDNTYTWYDSNSATNGGNAGTPGDGTDTEDFINALNAANFGGHSDWRMPTSMELRSIVDYGRYYPAVNTLYFPNTVASLLLVVYYFRQRYRRRLAHVFQLRLRLRRL